jgi:hypothetical protein
MLEGTGQRIMVLRHPVSRPILPVSNINRATMHPAPALHPHIREGKY